MVTELPKLLFRRRLLMLKVSKLNPKDTTLDEIHAIQCKIYQQQKGWDFEQVKTYYSQVVEKICSEFDVTFKRGTTRLLKKT